MSINNSLKMSLILLASLPLVFMTVLTYIFSYNKYLELARSSASELAQTYGEGFSAQLNVQIAEIEGLSRISNMQNFVLESYNGIALGSDSAYYKPVIETLQAASEYTDSAIKLYVYDINGYLIASNDIFAKGDWEEYMNTPVNEITETVIMKSSNINKNNNSIELITPITVKRTVVGLIRANIPATYFGAFIPDSGSAFILTNDGNYLFSQAGLSNNPELENEAKRLFNTYSSCGYLSSTADSVKNIYGYYMISDFNWIYLIRQDGTRYQQILSALPITLIIVLLIILIIAIWVSRKLTHKYTAPIFALKDNMNEAASGNLNSYCNITSNDEFGELADNFNQMMEIISSNYNELEESKKALEANENELKKNYTDIEKLAYHDILTGLYNRTAFMKYSHEIFSNSGTTLNRHAIYFIDLDNFKNVNDTLGHDYGDLLLKQVSSKLETYSSPEDIVARTGGDEFLILKNKFETKQDLELFAQHLVDIAGMPFDLDGEIAHVSMSIGIAIFPGDGLSVNELVKNADIAMYNAKSSGKNAYRFFNSYMEDDFNRKNELAEVLSKVIDNNEVYLNYQPQVNVATGQITGYEALMRINSDTVGFISPSEFIPIAEDSGSINELGEWALYEACGFNQALIQSGYDPLRVSVNVSTKQMKDNRLLDVIKSIPEKTGMELKYLEIEITESVLMNSFEHNLELINQFKELGVSIALDDFGTGYSSFNYLTQIPIDTLKIDKSFIDGICSNEKDKCIADSIISLAHKMDISVVAEGVEDVNQLHILQKQFCDTLQGYLFSKPLSSTEFIELLDKNRQKKFF